MNRERHECIAILSSMVCLRVGWFLLYKSNFQWPYSLVTVLGNSFPAPVKWSLLPDGVPLAISLASRPLSAVTRSILRCSANFRQSSRPFGIFTKNMAIIAPEQIANRNGKPIQLLRVLLIIACMTLGPMIEDCQISRDEEPRGVDSYCPIGNSK